MLSKNLRPSKMARVDKFIYPPPPLSPCRTPMYLKLRGCMFFAKKVKFVYYKLYVLCCLKTACKIYY